MQTWLHLICTNDKGLHRVKSRQVELCLALSSGRGRIRLSLINVPKGNLSIALSLPHITFLFETLSTKTLELGSSAC